MIDTSTRILVKFAASMPRQVGAVAIFVSSENRAPGGGVLGDAERSAANRLIEAGLFQGKSREVAIGIADGEDGGESATRVMLAGLGEAKDVSADRYRQAAAALIRTARRLKITRITMVIAADPRVMPAEIGAALATGALLAGFQFDRFKGTGTSGDEEPSRDEIAVTLVGESATARPVRSAVDRAIIVADSQNYARTLACRPGNDINPPTLANEAKKLAKATGLAVRVLDEKELAKLKMGGILAVGAGSNAPPRLIVLEHRPAKARASSHPLLVVGKSITFDTGGISIKPAEKMGRMIYDKSGGMAVLGLMAAVARLKLPVHVVGILSSAENHVSADAYRPGDIIRMYNGVTVEVTNTDAEGRLVLGDALAWGIETYKPTAVIDLATLTGGVIVALGREMAGAMTNSDELMTQVQRAADRAGEKIWRLPLGDEQREQIKSDHADIVNSAGREAHPLQGGAFLSYFVPRDNSVPWAHLDIAGPADTEKETPLYAKGGTGWGVRTLVEWAAAQAE